MSGDWNDNKIKKLLAACAEEEISQQTGEAHEVTTVKLLKCSAKESTEANQK